MNLRFKSTLALLVLACSPIVSQQPATPPAADPLTAAQQQQFVAIKNAAEQKAAPAALRLAEVAHKIYDNMLADAPSETLRVSLAAEMRTVVGELLDIKGQSIHDAVAVLTPRQKAQLKAEMVKPGAPGDLSELIGKMFQPAPPPAPAP